MLVLSVVFGMNEESNWIVMPLIAELGSGNCSKILTQID
jgi:hypothetical protein